jgi:class 3 adenylate cyclase
MDECLLRTLYLTLVFHIYSSSALSLSQYRYTDSEFKKDPTSTMTYPVFDSFEQTKKVAGVLTVNLYWSLYFKDVLSTKAKGIEVVLENTLNQSFTYRIDGPEATYLGPGDRHDPSYDYLMVSADVAKYVNTLASPATRSYTTVNLNDEYLAYKLRVYPSSKTEDDYLTNEPVIFTVVVAAVFLFTSMIFVFYDVVVARRQRIVMERALASGAIVNSLFPEQVRKQLYQENEQKTEPNSKAESFMRVEESSPRQNASLFENTTILFADLAGFTKWSSGKTPAQVFDLLEAFYGAFDAIALKRGVFKVETIGDCYVAVTGLPEPQKNHAIIMVRFARDCMAKLNELKHELVDKLGAETAELEMRVGLHSGPVTAGVLRGSKGRFQLFGDTMNTASRMESNGVRGRIHVSQATADEVTAKGKGQWVTAREDKITAKGKGEMQTYFIHAHDAKSSNKTSVFSDFD